MFIFRKFSKIYRDKVKTISKSISIILILAAILPGLANEKVDSTKAEKDLKFAVYPAVSYTPETSLMLGAVAFLVFKDKNAVPDQTFYRPNSLSPYVVYSLRNQLEINVDGEVYFQNKYNLVFATRYMNFPDYFFGIGNNTAISDQESYTNETFFLNGDLYQFNQNNPNLFYGLSFEFRTDKPTDFETDGILDSRNIPGKSGGFIWGLGPSIRYDTRDNILYPGKGSLMEFRSLYYPKFLGSQYGFNIIEADLRKYLSWGSKNIFAFQVRLRTAAGDEIPFYKLPQLGGSRRLRGINHANQYLDKKSFYTQLEYRRELFWRFGGVLFAGLGDVSASWSDFVPREFKFVYGIGGRFRAISTEKLNVRIDLGFTLNDQSGLYFVVKEAF